MNSAFPHGGPLYRGKEDREAPRDQLDRQTSPSGQSFAQPPLEESKHWWGARLSTGWTSREMQYGIDETGNYGAYTTELAFRIQNLTLGVWSGFGTGNDYQEWDFTVASALGLGPVFFTPGYNFRYQPGRRRPWAFGSRGRGGLEEHAHHEGNGHDEHGGHDEYHVHRHAEAGHSHGTYGNEIFFMLGTTAIPYVSPSMLFVCDLNNTPGSYLEIRLDGDIPLYHGVLRLEPYTLLGLNQPPTTAGTTFSLV